MSALGVGSGLLIHTLLAAFRLSVVLAASTWAFAVVKTAGAVYLIYLGFQALRKRVGTLDAPDLSQMGSWRLYRQGVVSNTLNPKVAIFFLASYRNSPIRRQASALCRFYSSGPSSLWAVRSGH